MKKTHTIADCTRSRKLVVDLSARQERVDALRSTLEMNSTHSRRLSLVEKIYTKKPRTKRVTLPMIHIGNIRAALVATTLIVLVAFAPITPIFASEEAHEEPEVVQETIEPAVEEVLSEEAEVLEDSTEEESPEEIAEEEPEESVEKEEVVVESSEEEPLEEDLSLEDKLKEITTELEEEESLEEVDTVIVEEDTTEEEQQEDVVEEVVEEVVVEEETATSTPEIIEEEATETQPEEVEIVVPILTLRGNAEVVIERGLGHAYVDLGAVAQDENGADLSMQTFVNGEEVDHIEINTQEEGEYIITYVARHQTGGEAEVTRSVVVANVEVEDTTEEVEQSPENTEDENPIEDDTVQEEEALNEKEQETTVSVDERNDIIVFNQASDTDDVDLESLKKEIREELSDEVRRAISKELRDGCLEFEDGSYYCMSDSESVALLDGTEDVRVSSGKDAEGDEEIFLHLDGKKLQITHNDTEDRFPSADVFGERIVWQSQVDSTWQIMLHNTNTGETVQVTHTEFNNMNPHVYKDSVVWQGWVNNNWEIFRAKIHSANDWTITQVTDNEWHDVFPKAALGLVTWQSFEGGIWSVMMHDLESGSTSRLSEGLDKYENPRFALLWDGRNDAGEVSVFEYDLSSGAIEDLRKKQEKDDQPEDIPEQPVEHEVPLPARSEVATSTQLLKDDETDE